MFQSPAKRRKTSENTSVPITTSEANAPPRSTPTTPTRPSYQSPTKASLARSHPHLAHTSDLRSLTESRGRTLRNEILNKSSAQNSRSSDDQQHTTNKEQSLPSPNNEPPPTDTELPVSEERAPLQPRQPSATNKRRMPSKQADEMPPPIIPKLVGSASRSSRARSRPDSNEPELPPTPVQLGIDPAPERPRGLSSSSPRSGSGRRRRRLDDERIVTSSPLKPNRFREVLPNVHDQESEAEMQEDENPTVDEDLPEELRQQKQQLAGLQKALQEAKQHELKLQQALGANNVDAQFTSDFLTQLKTSSTHTALPKDDSGSAPSYLPYRDLFAPGDLQLNTTTSTKLEKGNPKVVYLITITAPPPWPSHIFSASFEVTSDIENKRVENILWTDTLPGRAQSVGITNELHDWIAMRLQSALHGHDVGGLIWGIGTYFENAVKRARMFEKLSKKYPGSKGTSLDADIEEDSVAESEDKLSPAQLLRLIPYMSQSSMVFEVPTGDEEDGIRTRRGAKAAPKLIAIWKLDLTWTGSVHSTIDLVPSGIPDSAQQPVTELFSRLLQCDGFEKAFDSVYGMVKGETDQNVAAVSAVGKGAGKKRKRFT